MNITSEILLRKLNIQPAQKFNLAEDFGILGIYGKMYIHGKIMVIHGSYFESKRQTGVDEIT